MNATNPMSKLCLATSVLLGSTLISASTTNDQVPFSDPREWNFEVFLDDDPIGFHNFSLNPQDEGYRLETQAEFEVDFLFFTAYRYQHDNVEIWEDGCLQRIESHTVDNGDEFHVQGRRDEGEFEFNSTGENGEKASLDTECVRTFAYWDLDKLMNKRLLNAQTGSYVDVQVERVGRETIQVQGVDVDAERYKVDSDKLDLDLWYSPEGEWLKLRSNVENGRQLRYELRSS